MKYCLNRVATTFVLTALFILSVGYVHAEDGCSNASFQGRYGSQLSGVSATLAATVSVINFTADGHGNIPSGAAVKIFRRMLNTQNTTFSGTYSVNSDCTGSLTVTDNLGGTTVDNFVLDRSGSQLTLIDNTVLGNVISGIAERQSRDADDSCSLSSIKGQYSFLQTGLEDLAQFTVAGTFTADGNGKITGGTATLAQAPVTILNQPPQLLDNLTMTGTYSVNADCSGSLSLNIGTAESRIFSVVLVNKSSKVLLVDLRDGDAIDFLTAVARRQSGDDREGDDR